jgi:O-antigen ligase
MAALGLPVCLWAGTRPATGRVLRSLTVPALALLLTTLTLSYSRGAVLAAVIGLGCWFVLVPLRLRATLLLALGGLGGAIASGWALGHHAITHDGASLAARTAAGHDFGIVLLVVLISTALAGFAATRAMDRTVLSDHTRRRIGTALIILLALVPFAAIAGAAASSRGLTGQISHVWNSLTSTTPTVGNGPGRLADLSNSRPLYWSEGLKVGEHAPLAGVGAGGFDTARTRYSTSTLVVAHAHSYAIETFADLGVIGLVVSLALLAAWAASIRSTLNRTRGDERHADERTGLITMLAVVVTFGVSSLIDWTWFIPGVAVPALVCAGWVAGRGPLSQTQPTPAGEPATRRGIAPAKAAAVLGTVGALLIAAWFVWQPLHSSDQLSSAINALSRGDAPAALAAANSAAASDPVSVDPLWELAAIYSALRDPVASREEWVKATQVQPSNPETWQQLGVFDLQAHRPQLALAELEVARRLDLTSPLTIHLIDQAHNQLVSAAHANTGSA